MLTLWSYLVAWAAWTQCVDLVKEDHTRSRVASSLEDLSDSPLALSHILQTQSTSQLWGRHRQHCYCDHNFFTFIQHTYKEINRNKNPDMQIICRRVRLVVQDKPSEACFLALLWLSKTMQQCTGWAQHSSMLSSSVTYHVEQLWSFDRDEVEAWLVGYGLSGKRIEAFSEARWENEQHDRAKLAIGLMLS